jgi:probable phosphoglycerate mutase
LKPKKIYLIRHGQTNYNRMGIVQGGGIDSDLNETGRRQAQAFFEYYKDIPFDKVYTSGLKRTWQSVQGFIDKGIPWETHPGLNEINWGHREGTKITPEEDAYYYQVIDAWSKGDITLRIDGGESPQDVQNRQKPALDLILSRPEESTILICMHGRAMRVFLSFMLNYPLQCMDVFEHQNLCLYKLVYTGNMFSVESFNDVTHLKELLINS